jgi:hypothetical protein
MMKNHLFSKFTNFSLAVAAIGLVSLTSCDKDDDIVSDETYSLSGQASGTQVVPPVTTTATGNFSGAYNSNTNVMQYNINWNGLAAAPVDSISIYGPAAAGANGSLIGKVAITTPGVTGSATGTAILTEEEESGLLNDQWYFVVSNSMHPDGEIRGQIDATENP